MKKLFLPIIAFALSMLVTSCIGGDVYETNESYSDLELQTMTVTVQPDQWEVDGTPGTEGATLISEWSVIEITQTVLNYGSVQVSYFFYDEHNRYVEHPLPYVLPYYDTPSNIIETYRCFYERGKITFVIEASDFQCVIPRDPVCFKIAVLSPR